jgi:DNA replication protein DnaC
MGDALIETYKEKKRDMPEFEKPVVELVTGFEGRLDGEFAFSEEQQEKERRRAEANRLHDIQQMVSRLELDISRFGSVTFDDYQAKTEKQKNVLQLMIDLGKKDWKQIPQPVSLFGKVGTGKDHLLTCLAREVVKQGVSVRYFIAEHFYHDCSDRFKSNQSEKDFNKKYVDPDILIFSDPIRKKWVKSETTDAGHERFCSIVKQRAQKRKPTWLTGNLFGCATLKDGIKLMETVFGSDVVRRLTENAVLCWCDWHCYTIAAQVIE